MSRISNAQSAQRKHWETTGQLLRCLRLLEYILAENATLPKGVADSIHGAKQWLSMAIEQEYYNNEFINLNLKPTWKKRK